jgi:hypothetical protein
MSTVARAMTAVIREGPIEHRFQMCFPVDWLAVFVKNHRQRQASGGGQQQPLARRAKTESARVNFGESGKRAAGTVLHGATPWRHEVWCPRKMVRHFRVAMSNRGSPRQTSGWWRLPQLEKHGAAEGGLSSRVSAGGSHPGKQVRRSRRVAPGRTDTTTTLLLR